MTEKLFTKKLRQHLTQFHVYTMEAVGGAIPDLHIRPLSHLPPFWAEAKMFHSGTKRLVFQKGQTLWLSEYANTAKSCIPIIIEETGDIVIYDGKHAKRIERMQFSAEHHSYANVKPIYSSGTTGEKIDWSMMQICIKKWLAE